MRDPRFLKIDQGRLWASLEAINRHGSLPSGGVERLAWTDAEVAARRWLQERCEQEGLSVEQDEAGNVWAFTDGRPAVVMGSHLDTVPNGGRFDGALGIAGALEVLLCARESALPGGDRLALVCFTDEEGVRFGVGMTGSRAVAGDLTTDDLKSAVTTDGTTLWDLLASNGKDPQRVPEAGRRRRDMAAYLELHIEQGRRLERAGAPVGVVTGVVSVSHWRLEVRGEPNHAGTTLPEDRRDALVPLAVAALEAQRVMRAHDGLVATVGEAAVLDGAPNIVPGRTHFTLDIRSMDTSLVKSAEHLIIDAARRAARENGCELAAKIKRLPRVPMANRVVTALRRAVDALGAHEGEPLDSMAGHDGMNLSAAGVPCGMVFVRSRDGVSHSPREYSSPEDCALGAAAMGIAALELARDLP